MHPRMATWYVLQWFIQAIMSGESPNLRPKHNGRALKRADKVERDSRVRKFPRPLVRPDLRAVPKRRAERLLELVGVERWVQRARIRRIWAWHKPLIISVPDGLREPRILLRDHQEAREVEGQPLDELSLPPLHVLRRRAIEALRRI